jgi:4-cresol dehydrogenase (hydroxylating) flavoprotein subunit
MTAKDAALLPPGVSPDELGRALRAFAGALGDEGVLRPEQDEVREFRDPYAFAAWDDFWPSAVVLPATVEEVQEVVRIANRFRVPLWTTSLGRNNAYGGPSPRVRGSVVLSLRRMNRVLEVDEELAYAVVEPGVSFFDLCAELRRRGSALWASIPDLGWGSVVGNALDHGVGYMPEGDHASTVCGMEVVLASGEVVRTGMGALPASAAWHAHRRGFGPSVDALFMQSNFGVVTKLGKWLTPRPEVYMPVMVKARHESDLEAMVDTLRPLLLDGTIRNVPLLGTVMGAAAMAKPRSAWHPGEGPLPEAFFRRVMDERGLGWWNLRFALYGAEAVLDAQLAKITAAFSRIPDAEVVARKVAGEDVSDETVVLHPERIQAGIPGMALLDSLQWWGGVGGHLDFSPVAPLRGRHVRELTQLLRPEIERAGLDYWPGAIATPRSLIHVCPILYDTTNEQQVRAAYELYGRLVELTGAAGYGLYRGHVAFMDEIAAQYDWGDHAMLRLTERIKDALDPNGILSPGKQGIWPESMRDGGARTPVARSVG